MTKVPPKAGGSSRPRQNDGPRPRRSRSTERAERLRAASATQKVAELEEGDAAGLDGRPEPEVTAEELRKEGERQAAEGWNLATDLEEDRSRKLDRDEGLAKEERPEGKDAPAASGQKEGSKDQLKKQGVEKAQDGFEAGGQASKKLERAAVAALKGLSESLSRPGRPADPMALLHAAQQAGVFFKEDWQREGHSEDQEDPELRAAVEEAIRLLFGVQGIHRVGPGRNDAGELVVVIVASRGFGEAQLKVVPPSVHRFPTLLAIPYELLPLRRER